MPFLPEPATTGRSPGPQDVENAKALYAALKGAGKLLRAAKMRTWATEFRLLGNYVPPERVTAALTFVTTHAAKMGTPRYPPVHSAATFRSCFAWVEDVMAKELRSPAVTITQEAEVVYLRLRDGWHGTPREDVLNLIQVTITEYAAFRRAVAAVAKAKTAIGGVWRFAEILLAELPDAQGFAHSHAKAVREFVAWAVKKHGAFRGSVAQRAFDPASEDFDKRCRGVSIKWAGQGEVWEFLKKEMANGQSG